MKTKYMIVSMKREEILCEELGPITDLDLAQAILKLYTPAKYRLAYIAKQDHTQWEKV